MWTVFRSTAIAILLAWPTPAHADPGLSSLKGLLPLYIVAFGLYVLTIYVLPVGLILRARKSHAQGDLSRKKLLLLTAPAGFVGIMGLIGFAHPLTLVYGIVGSEANLGLMRVIYWSYTAFSVLLVYLAVSTYRRCQSESEEGQ